MRPHSIELFEKVYLGSLAIGLANTAFNWGEASSALDTPEATAAGLGSGFLIGTMAVALLVSLLLWYFIARRASTVAKWILVVVTAFGLLGVITSLTRPNALSAMVIIGVISTLLQLYAVWLLFRPDAVRWLHHRGREGIIDPATFE